MTGDELRDPGNFETYNRKCRKIWGSDDYCASLYSIILSLYSKEEIL